MSKEHILIIINSGWAMRNYVLSGLIDDLLNNYRISVYLPNLKTQIQEELVSKKIKTYRFLNFDSPLHYNMIHTIFVEAHNRRHGYWHQELRLKNFSLLSLKQKIFYIISQFFALFFTSDFLYRYISEF